MNTADSSLLSIHNLTITVGEKTLCDSLSLDIHAGEFWAILGKNGTGKTTLLHTLLGLRPAASGMIKLQGESITHLSRKTIATTAGLLLQDIHDVFPGTVMETVLIGRHPHLRAWQWESAQDIALAQRALQQVDLQGFEQRQVTTLSGGERRRLYLATLLVQQPRLYFLDEPVNHLDLHHQHHVMQLLEQRRQQPDTAIVTVLHDINLAAHYCDHVLLLSDNGEIVHGPADTLLSAATLSALYQHPVREINDGTDRFFVSV